MEVSSGHLVARVERRILHIRGHKVMLDADLAELYGSRRNGLMRRSGEMRYGSRKTSCFGSRPKRRKT